MSDPVLCIVVYAVFLAAMAAAHFFKTLDNDLGTAWRTAFAVGLAVAVRPLLRPRALSGRRRHRAHARPRSTCATPVRRPRPSTG